ncbi:MAG: hypothetical protein Q9213_000649 [Squamulea squamosa]
MSFRHRSISDVLELRPQQTLPSLGHVLNEHARVVDFNASSPGQSPNFASTPVQDQGPGQAATTQISSAKAAEVMQKTRETLRAQIHANGFTDEDIRKAKETDLRKANEGDVVHAKAKALTEITQEEPVEDEADEDYERNPYEDRADKIGLSHRIPGIGHLGDLLTPPNWRIGDDPIPPKLARELYREAYDAAKKCLADTVAEFKDLKGAAFQEASDQRNQEWQNHSNLAKLILDERVRVYQMYQERRRQQSQADQRRPGRQVPALRVQHPSPPKVQGLPVGVAGPDRYTYGQSHPQNGFLSLSNGIVSRPAGGFDQPEPSPKVLSPSFLDPSLIPGTIEAVLQRYHSKKTEIQKIHRENETELRQCLTKYRQHLHVDHPQARQANLVPRHLSPNLHANQQPLPALQSLPYYHPLPNRRNETHKENGDEHEAKDEPTLHRYASPPGQNALGIYQDAREDEPVELALSSPLKQFCDESKTPQLQQPTPQKTNGYGTSSEKAVSKEGTPQKIHPVTEIWPQKPATSRYARDKKPVWYASHLEKANLPTSTLSETAIQAGLAYDPKAPPAAKVTEASLSNATKKRRRNGDNVPVPEFKMPPEKIRAMFASSMPIKYVGKGPNPYLTAIGTAVAGENDSDSPVKKNGKAKAKVPISKTESIASAPHDASDISDDNDDDEKDATYGGRAKSRTPKKGESIPVKRTTPRKAKTPRMTKAQMAIETQLDGKEDDE